MINKSLVFKILSIILICLNILFLTFFIASSIFVFVKVWVFLNLHFILFLIVLILNLIYLTFYLTMLLMNAKRAKNRKIKNT